jgi:hypothetical protein
MKLYKTNSPVLLLLFNRPDYTKLVFEEVRKAKPNKLYIAIDGPRENNQDDVIKINLIKDYIINNIDWECKVDTLFRNSNLGCMNAVSSAITWFFQNESKGIILEDDCLPDNSFFSYCDELLTKYEFDDRVRHISGVNFLDNNIEISESYYFSKFTHVWGWASWRRVWKDYSKDILNEYDFDNFNNFYNVYPNRKICKAICNEFKRVKSGNLNTWDYQYLFLNFINNGLTTIPKYTLVQNIGFDNDSTHTQSNPYNMRELRSLDIISHPSDMIPNINNDILSLKEMFKINKFSKAYSRLRAFKNKFK